jgi:predicted DNA-binding transcriptional regulator AlpA
VFVNYRYLEQRSIVTNRMCLARAIENYGFPKPYALGANRLSWDLQEVEDWIASRPRRAPKTGEKKPSTEVVEAVDSAA